MAHAAWRSSSRDRGAGEKGVENQQDHDQRRENRMNPGALRRRKHDTDRDGRDTRQVRQFEERTPENQRLEERAHQGACHDQTPKEGGLAVVVRFKIGALGPGIGGWSSASERATDVPNALTSLLGHFSGFIRPI